MTLTPRFETFMELRAYMLALGFRWNGTRFVRD